MEITLFNELKALDYSQRLRDRSRAALALPDRSTGRVLFDQAARSGAQAADRDSGRIEVGAQADLIGLEIDNPVACNRAGDQVLDTLIFGGRGQDCVRELWSAGRHIVTGGRHADRDRIARRFLTTLAELEQAL